MTADITVIIPYHNEERSLARTIAQAADQVLRPREVIFVDSSSTDSSSRIIDDWIAANQPAHGPRFLNIHEGTDTPSSSKNVGIRRAKTGWVAFMDCGQGFGPDWLESQWKRAQDGGLDLVLGACHAAGVNAIDRSVMAQSYGYKRLRACVPSSLVKRSVFEKTGLFLENRRAGYDMDWLILVRGSDIAWETSPKPLIRYFGVNYADTLAGVFRKSLTYAVPTVGMRAYRTPYYYLLLFGLVAAGSLCAPRLIPVFALLYLLCRGYAAPLLKSRGMRIIIEDPLCLIFLPTTACVWDLGRLIGIFIGVYRYHIRGA